MRISTVMKEIREGLGRPLAVTVASGKGGVGKSILSLSIGVELAANGVRTLLVDTDFGLGNLHIYANATPTATIEDVLAGKCSPEDASIEIGDNLTLIAARNGFSDENIDVETSLESISSDIEWLDASFDAVILDLSAGISDVVSKLIGLSDVNLIVTAPEVAALADSYALAKFSVKARPGTAIAFVLNRVTAEREGMQTAQNLNRMTRKFLRIKLPTVALVREHPNLRSMVQTSAIVTPGFDDREWSLQIREIIHSLRAALPDDLSRWMQDKWGTGPLSSILNTSTIDDDTRNMASLPGSGKSAREQEPVTSGKDSL